MQWFGSFSAPQEDTTGSLNSASLTITVDLAQHKSSYTCAYNGSTACIKGVCSIITMSGFSCVSAAAYMTLHCMNYVISNIYEIDLK